MNVVFLLQKSNHIPSVSDMSSHFLDPAGMRAEKTLLSLPLWDIRLFENIYVVTGDAGISI